MDPEFAPESSPRPASRGGGIDDRVYAELRRIARAKLAGSGTSGSLHATVLVNEAWLRLRESPDFAARDSQHFLAAAAQAMRWIVVDQARRRRALRLATQLSADPNEWPSERIDHRNLAMDEQLIALDVAFERLQAAYPREAAVAAQRYFAGLSVEETAEALALSPATVKRHWAFARAWLLNALDQENR
ncbi:MAG: ECF-type sigma factor [Planctomycetota bacterium]